MGSDKTLCCVEHVDCIVKYYFSCRDIQLLTWTPLGRVSYYSAFSPLLDQKLSSLGRNGFAIIVRWGLQRTPQSVGLRYSVSSMGCYYSSYSSPSTRPSEEQENDFSVLRIRLLW